MKTSSFHSLSIFDYRFPKFGCFYVEKLVLKTVGSHSTPYAVFQTTAITPTVIPIFENSKWISSQVFMLYKIDISQFETF